MSKLDHIVEVDYPLPEVNMAATSELAARIAKNVAGLIPDGATLQTGIGAIPDSVLKQLGDRKHLGVHTELFSDGIIDLVERGVIDGEKKTLHPGKIIAGFMVGTQRRTILYGDSLILEGVRARLACDPSLEVIMLDSPLDKPLEQLRRLNPAVIIFDLSAIQPDFPLAMLQHPDLLLVGINPETHQALVWSGREAAAFAAADLMEILQDKERMK